MFDPLDAYRTHLLAAGRPHTTVRLRLWQLRRVAEVTPLLSATTADLAEYLAAQDWAPVTRYSVRATLLDFYRVMVAAGRVRHSPADGLPTVRVHRRTLPACVGPDAAVATYRTDADADAAGYAWPASWHRAICGRAADEVPDLRLTYWAG